MKVSKKTKHFAFDFETTAHKNLINNGITRKDEVPIYQYSIKKSDEKGKYTYRGVNIESFMKDIWKTSNALYWAHNLTFDFSYILQYLSKQSDVTIIPAIFMDFATLNIYKFHWANLTEFFGKPFSMKRKRIQDYISYKAEPNFELVKEKYINHSFVDIIQNGLGSIYEVNIDKIVNIELVERVWYDWELKKEGLTREDAYEQELRKPYYKITKKSIKFWDTYKHFNTSLAHIGSIVGGDEEKLVWDYNKYQSVKRNGIGIYVEKISDIIKYDWEYVYQDANLVVYLINELLKTSKLLNTPLKMTQGSFFKAHRDRYINGTGAEWNCDFDKWNEVYGKTIYKYIKSGDFNNKSRKGLISNWMTLYNDKIIPGQLENGIGVTKATKILFDDQLSDGEFNAFSQIMKGGFVSVGVKYGHQLVDLRKVKKERIGSVDANSSYPAAVLDYLPIGGPSKKPWKGWKNLKVYRISIAIYHCKLQYPAILWSPGTKVSNSSKYIRSYRTCENNDASYILSLTEIDYELLIKSDIFQGKYIKIIDTLYFKAEKEIHRPWVEYLYNTRKELKTKPPEEWTEKDKLVDKTFKVGLNSWFGKQGAKRLRVSTLFSEEEKSFVKGLTLNKFSPINNIVLASFIAARGRQRLINAIFKCCDSKHFIFLYTDTDSIYYIDKGTGDIEVELGIEINPTKLGAWGREITNGVLFKCLKAKNYMVGLEKPNQKGKLIIVKIAGLPKKIQEEEFNTYDDLINKYNYGVSFKNGKTSTVFWSSERLMNSPIVVIDCDYTISKKH